MTPNQIMTAAPTATTTWSCAHSSTVARSSYAHGSSPSSILRTIEDPLRLPSQDRHGHGAARPPVEGSRAEPKLYRFRTRSPQGPGRLRGHLRRLLLMITLLAAAAGWAPAAANASALIA